MGNGGPNTLRDVRAENDLNVYGGSDKYTSVQDRADEVHSTL